MGAVNRTPGQNEIVDFLTSCGGGNRDHLIAWIKADNGDIQFQMSPATGRIVAGAAPWQQNVQVSIETAAAAAGTYPNELHAWFNMPVAFTVTKSSAAGSVSATQVSPVQVVDGVATITLNGTGTWAAGDTVTLTMTAATVWGFTVPVATCVLTAS